MDSALNRSSRDARECVLDLSIPKNVELLQAELQKAFPDCTTAFLLGNPYSFQTGIWLGFSARAYVDISWGWQTQADLPASRTPGGPEYRRCSLGGRFVRESTSVGD
jgi:hypothetical protein